MTRRVRVSVLDGMISHLDTGKGPFLPGAENRWPGLGVQGVERLGGDRDLKAPGRYTDSLAPDGRGDVWRDRER